MPEIKSGTFIVMLEVDATYETQIGNLVTRLEEEAKRMQDPPNQRLGKPAVIRGVEILGVHKKRRSDW